MNKFILCKHMKINIFSAGNYYFLDTLIRDYDNTENMKCDVKFFGGAVSENSKNKNGVLF